MQSPIQGNFFNYVQKINNNGRIVVFRHRLPITDAKFCEIEKKEEDKKEEDKK